MTQPHHPATPATVSYGLPPLGRARGWAAVLLKYLTLPVVGALIALALLGGWAPLPTGIVLVLGAIVGFFDLIALISGLVWRRHGRSLRGVVFRLDEQPPVVLLNGRLGALARPLSQLRTIEVRYSSGGDQHSPEDNDEFPWLCLKFAEPARRYHLNAYLMNHFTLDRRGFASVDGGPSLVPRQLRQLLTAHNVVVTDHR